MYYTVKKEKTTITNQEGKDESLVGAELEGKAENFAGFTKRRKYTQCV